MQDYRRSFVKDLVMVVLHEKVVLTEQCQDHS
jgi:hypothetical protein